MVTLANNTLMHFEDLTLPSFQVIVMSGSIGCARCRQRVSQVIAKMTGLREYTVDVKRKQVIVKGDFGNQQKQEDDYSKSEMNKERGNCHPLRLLLGSFVASCFRKQVAD
ncbi:uncharacterized protein LOC110603554 [Manihot esculenta]|uniref:Uncharacterized protein n=2 Tax=Manihot esculenta TaxID=3983 RepID=A0ACB7I303_MANES|nr:uncharacterized protein LOC110603554 [Manihot esculenta]KAG8659449.1 hypothetical protein MANES_02G038800v8 [Manihot esculenta]KAG8659450.1 hypothetical protein MANES_02G038800v8 [Manihot esculenta]